MEPIILTRKDEMMLAEMTNDKIAAERTLKEAMSHFHNTQAKIIDRERLLWEHFYEAYSLDRSKTYKMDTKPIFGRTFIVEEEENNPPATG